MHTESHRLDSSITEAELMTLIDALNRDESVHGILVQLPLQPHIDKAGLLLAIDSAKDVDGFHPMNAGLMASTSDGKDHRIVPCPPIGCMLLLAAEIGSTEGLHAVSLEERRVGTECARFV